MHCQQCGNKLDKDSKFCGKCGTENKLEESSKTTEINIKDYNFLYIPTSRLILVTFLSLGIYEIYWFVSNWTAIKKVTNEKIQPFWRGVFSIFYFKRPFELALKQAKDLDYDEPYDLKFLSGFYVVAWIAIKIINKSPDIGFIWSIVGIAFLVYPLVQVQKAVNWSNHKKGNKFKEIGLPEYGLIGLNLGIILLSFLANS